MTLAYLGLGANLGDAKRIVSEVMLELGRLRRTAVTGRSSLYRSAAIGYEPQPDFINAVVRVDTELDAEDLLDELQSIEKAHARERSFRNAPRTLDLDLLLYGEAKISTRRLTVPHPRMHQRAFVLRPLLDLDPGISIPDKGAASELLAACSGQQIERLD